PALGLFLRTLWTLPLHRRVLSRFRHGVPQLALRRAGAQHPDVDRFGAPGLAESAASTCTGERMNALARRIARMIEMEGPISVSTYMMLALHDHEMGFYATRESIGAQGAFVTASEISQAFGELLGLWCAASWRDQGSPAQPLLVDLGPGRGTLMAD